MRKKLIIASIALVLSVVALSGAAFAWLVSGDTLLDVRFETGYVGIETSIKKAQDSDRDGVPDRDETGVIAVPYTENRLRFDNMYPSACETYILYAENKGNVASTLAVSWSEISGAAAASLTVSTYYNGIFISETRLSDAADGVIEIIPAQEFGDGSATGEGVAAEIRMVVRMSAESGDQLQGEGQDAAVSVGKIRLTVTQK